jgi:hypothetical protein
MRGRRLWIALALLDGCASGARTREAKAPVPRHKLIDLTSETGAFVAATRGQSAAEQLSIFRSLVLDRHPELYGAGIVDVRPNETEAEVGERVRRGLAALPGLQGAMAQLAERLPEALARAESRLGDHFPPLDVAAIYLSPSLGAFEVTRWIVSGRPTLLVGLDTLAAERGANWDPEPRLLYHLVLCEQDQIHGAKDGSTLDSLWRAGLAAHATRLLQPAAPPADLGLPERTDDEMRRQVPQVARDLRARLPAPAAAFTVREAYVGLLVVEIAAVESGLGSLSRKGGLQRRIEVERALAQLEGGTGGELPDAGALDAPDAAP